MDGILKKYSELACERKKGVGSDALISELSIHVALPPNAMSTDYYYGPAGDELPHVILYTVM